MARYALAICTLLMISSLSFLPGKASNSNHPGEVFVIQAIYPSYELFAEVASELDILVVDHSTRSFQALVTTAQIHELVTRGFQVSIEENETSRMLIEAVGTCYRKIDELYAQLEEINENYPQITELIQYGSSYEGRPLWILKITNKDNQVDKPRYLVMSGTHGREMITPETAMVFIDHLLTGYKRDPDITTIIDWQETYVIVSANPDGHVRNEIDYSWWRKNTHPYSTCTTGTYGVDLNRNHEFLWGNAGSSTNPCSEIYRGPFPASEPETIALQNLVRSLFPDRREPDLTAPAPRDTSGVLITIHSFAELILWPWGHTFTPAPNGDGLAILGRQMARFNNYTPAQSIELYPTSGTSDDWAYGELGIAAFTFEIGDKYDGFNPSCSRYEALVQPNVEALHYAAMASYAPYIMPSGPEVISITGSKTHLSLGESLEVTAFAKDGILNGGNPIQEIRVFLDLPPWVEGSSFLLQPEDGLFDQNEEMGKLTLAIANLPEGQHYLIFQARDQQGNPGLLATLPIWVGDQMYIPMSLR